MKRITVLLAEDHCIVREGLRCLLSRELDIEVVGKAETGREAIRLARKLRPAVILMDLEMPLVNGMEATRQVRKDAPEAKVIILSAYSDDCYVKQVIELGATGFLLKQTSAGNLATAIREVEKGKKFFAPSLLRRFDRLNPCLPNGARAPDKKRASLTPREMEVLQLIVEGNANKQTAMELGISIKTVGKHREHLMKKLDIHDTAGLTRYAISAGIIDSNVQLTIE